MSSGEHPCGVPLNANVAIRSCKSGLALQRLEGVIAWGLGPSLASVASDEQGQTTVHGIPKHQPFVCIPPRHGIQEHSSAGVVVNPFGMHRRVLCACNPCWRSNAGSEPMFSGEGRRAEGGRCAVRRHPLLLGPVRSAVLSLADPAVRSCIPDVSLRLHVKRSHAAWHFPLRPFRVRGSATRACRDPLKVNIVLLMVRK